MPEPGPDARGRGSSSGCGVWTASAPGSPPCSPCDRPASSSTADVARYAGRGGTVARSSDTCVVFAWSSAGILQPPMMRTSTPHRDVGRRRAEEDEETFTGSLSKKTPPKNTAVSHRWNHYTFRSVLAQFDARVVGSRARRPAARAGSPPDRAAGRSRARAPCPACAESTRQVHRRASPGPPAPTSAANPSISGDAALSPRACTRCFTQASPSSTSQAS